MQYDTLVVSGGGSKGMILLGILHHIWEFGLLKNIDLYSGSSVGSVIITLLSLGYTPLDIFQDSLIDISLSKQHINIKRLLYERGLITLDPFLERISILIKKKIGFIPTLAELESKTSKTLYISVTNTETDDTEYLCSCTHSSLSIIDAIAMSCSIPLIFPPKLYKGVYYVDGGLSDNLPITPVILRMDKTPSVEKDTSEGVRLKDPLLRKSNILAIEVLRKDTITTSNTSNILSYIYKLLNIPVNKMQKLQNIDALSKAVVKKITVYWDSNRNSSLVGESNDILELDLSEEKKIEMFTFGYKEAALDL